MSRAVATAKSVRYGRWETVPPDTCRICGMHDPTNLASWGGGRAHDTCIEWLDDPHQAPMPCGQHEYGYWEPYPSKNGRPRRRRYCDRCSGYQTVYVDAPPRRLSAVGSHTSTDATIHALPPLPDWLVQHPD